MVVPVELGEEVDVPVLKVRRVAPQILLEAEIKILSTFFSVFFEKKPVKSLF